MKKTDIALLILIVSISVAVAYFLGRALINEPKMSSATVESVELIEPTVTTPSKTVFNKDAINPTVPIEIGNSSNQQPFRTNQ